MKYLLILLLNFLLIFSFSSCENNGTKDLFSKKDNEILQGKFLEKKTENKTENKSDKIFKKGDDLFKGADFDSGENDLGANLISDYDGNSFYKKTGLDLYKLSGSINFGSGTFTRNGKTFNLNPEYGDKIYGLKIAFADESAMGIFDSIAYGGYGMDDVSVSNGTTNFNLYFDGDDNSNRATILKKIFTDGNNFDTQVKLSEGKKNGSKYVPAKIHTSVVHQDLSNEYGGSLLKWPCLSSDFTYVEDDFKNKDELFPKEFYEKTSTGYVLDDNGNWDKDNGIDLINNGINSNTGDGLCAFNDTYDYVKGNVVGSQCWEGETSKDVGRLVFRIKKGSFCTQAKSIEEEVNYPKYACNIGTGKTLTDKSKKVQEYLGGDVLYLTGSTVDDSNSIFSNLTELKYTCGEKK